MTTASRSTIVREAPERGSMSVAWRSPTPASTLFGHHSTPARTARRSPGVELDRCCERCRERHLRAGRRQQLTETDRLDVTDRVQDQRAAWRGVARLESAYERSLVIDDQWRRGAADRKGVILGRGIDRC